MRKKLFDGSLTVTDTVKYVRSVDAHDETVVIVKSNNQNNTISFLAGDSVVQTLTVNANDSTSATVRNWLVSGVGGVKRTAGGTGDVTIEVYA